MELDLAQKGLIVANKDEKLRTRPIRQTLTIPFPTPQDLKIVWCEFQETFKKCVKMSETFKIRFILFATTVLLCTGLAITVTEYLLTSLHV